MSDDDSHLDFTTLSQRLVDVDPQAFEDEQLAAAIAASLAEEQARSGVPPSTEGAGPSRSAPVSRTNGFEIISDSESERDASPAPGESDTPVPRPVDVAPTSSNSFLSERAQLEKARLERQQALKRQRDEDQSSSNAAGPSNQTSDRPMKIM